MEISSERGRSKCSKEGETVSAQEEKKCVKGLGISSTQIKEDKKSKRIAGEREKREECLSNAIDLS